MYEEIFQSSSRPFRATPDAKFYFAHPSIETARQAAIRAVERAEGPVMVLGGAGLGKSLLTDVLSRNLKAQFDIVRLHAARLSSRMALLQGILFELDLPYRDQSEGELRLAILDRLEPDHGHKANGIVILVDEAHTLSSKLLDELRLISNFTRNNEPRARLVLLGNMQLEETFASPQLESFNQRLAARCYLTPMSESDTRAFVEHQFRVAGINPTEIMSHDGLESVFAGSQGVPRIANQLVDHAIVLAVANERDQVTGELIEEAWADLQQLPIPWQSANAPLETPALEIQSTAVEAVDEPQTLEHHETPEAEFPETPSEEHTNLELAEAEEQLLAEKSELPPQRDDIGPAGLVDDYASELTAGPQHSDPFVSPQGSTEEFASLPDLQNLADEIANVERVSYEVEFGELQDDPQIEDSPENFEPTSSSVEEQLQAAFEVAGTFSDEAVTVASDQLSETAKEDQEDRSEEVVDELKDESEVELEAQTQLDCDLEPTLDPPISHNVGNNYFAAFTPPEQGELPASIEEALSAESYQPTVGTPTPQPNDIEQEKTEAAETSSQLSEPLPPDSFFASKPTDEQMIAFEEEQFEFDVKGVWENSGAEISIFQIDPDETHPTSAEMNIQSDEEQHTADVNEVPEEQNAVTDETVIGTPSKEDLFGEDFEEELSLQELSSTSSAVPHTPLPPEAHGSRLEERLEEYRIEALREHEEHLRHASETAPGPEATLEELPASEVTEVAGEPSAVLGESRSDEDSRNLETTLSEQTQDHLSSDMRPAEISYEGSLIQLEQADLQAFMNGNAHAGSNAWSVDVVAIDLEKELAVHNEINDLVSSLNFSGIQMGYSIEQIPVDSPSNTRKQIESSEVAEVNDSVPNPSLGSELFGDATEAYDDDRDMLIVEEELPSPIESEVIDEPVKLQRQGSYSQLFAKLRN